LEQERTYLMSQYNGSWPAISEVDKKIATARAQMGPKDQNLYFSERNIRNPALALLNNRLASLEVEEKALGQQLNELDDQSRQADQRIKSLREGDNKLHSLQFSRDVAEGVYRQLYLKKPATVFQESVVGERNANLRVVQPPTAPVIGHSMAISYLFGGVFLGLLLGVAATLIATVLRDVYIAPSEAERDLKMPGLAAFGSGALDGDTAGDQADIASFAALLQEVTVEGHLLRSLQFSGVSEGDGRDAVIRALAVELATGYARRTLLIDLQGDGHDHVAALGGIAGGLTTPQTLPVHTTSTEVADLWVAVDTRKSIFGDPRASVERIRLALEALRQQFSMLLVIAPADSATHAMRRLASLVDANVLVLRAEHSRSPVAERLRDTLLTAGGNILGFIFVGRKYYIPSWLYRWI
jgi:Mrp family chromosome partitioning ATPase